MTFCGQTIKSPKIDAIARTKKIATLLLAYEAEDALTRSR